jgi:uncharacterized protein (DUF58 family)
MSPNFKVATRMVGSPFIVSSRSASLSDARARRVAQAHMLAARMPHLKMEARHVVSAIYGMHGRRHSGGGETFWQYRPYQLGESMRRIDWRRSSRDDRLYVREREWEAAHVVYLWIDRSESMDFSSLSSGMTKLDRAMVLMLALADALVDAGESVGVLDAMKPKSIRHIIEHISDILMRDDAIHEGQTQPLPLPLPQPLPSHADVIIFTDALEDLETLRQRLKAIAQNGARGFVVHVIDPVEEAFPYTGQIHLIERETGLELNAGDGQAWGERYRQRFAAHKDMLMSLCRTLNWRYMVHHTDRPASEAALGLMLALAPASPRQQNGGR